MAQKVPFSHLVVVVAIAVGISVTVCIETPRRLEKRRGQSATSAAAAYHSYCRARGA